MQFAAEPRRWRAEAQDLRRAARVLQAHWFEAPAGEGGAVALPALLLAGYAIENYAKARIIELEPAEWVRPYRVSWKGKGHDLPWLVRRAGIEPDDAELVLLRRLKQIVEWAGRYPAPLNFVLSAGEEWPRQAFETDFGRIERLYERLNVSATPRPAPPGESGGRLGGAMAR